MLTLFQIYKESDFGKVPKYEALMKAIKKAIELGVLGKADRLPSIKEYKDRIGLGKETVLKALGILIDEGILSSVQGRGFFVERTNFNKEFKLFVLFDELSSYKEVLYNSMVNTLGKRGEIQVFFHHYNIDVFETLIDVSIGDYTHYVVMPFQSPKVADIIKRIPRDKIYILDRNENVEFQGPSVCQDFGKDTYQIISAMKGIAKKYNCFNLVFPKTRNHPPEIISGFQKACEAINMPCEVIDRIEPIGVQCGDAYLLIEDCDLVNTVEIAKSNGWLLGKDLGIISYNEMPMKRVISTGISTISTNFEKMGQRMIELIMEGKSHEICISGKFTDRGSL